MVIAYNRICSRDHQKRLYQNDVSGSASGDKGNLCENFGWFRGGIVLMCKVVIVSLFVLEFCLYGESI